MNEIERKARSRRILPILAAVLASALQTALRADPQGAGTPLLNLSLEELGNLQIDTVFAASMFTQKVTDAPSSISIVTKDEIKRFGYRDLGEIVRSVAGFDVTYDRDYTSIGVRGFNRLGDFGGRTLLMIDGHRMNDPIFDVSAGGNDFLLDLDLIERVEFIRGPGASIYGNNAFFGVINVVTRRPADLNGVEASGTAGSFDSYRGRLSFGKDFANGMRLLLSGSYFDSAGHSSLFFPEFNSPTTNNGVAHGIDGEMAWSFYGSLAYQDFTLRGGYVDRQKAVPTAPYGTVFNRETDTYDRRGYVELAYAHQLCPGLELAGHIHYDEYDYHGTFPFDDGTGNVLLNQDSARARWIGLDANASWEVTQKLRLSLGFEWRRSLELRQRNYIESPFAQLFDRGGSQQVFGTFLESKVDVTRWLTLNVGARYDHYSSFGDTVNPRVGLIFKPGKATAIKLLYGQAFRAPNEYEINFRPPGALEPTNISPEKIHTYELVGEHYFNSEWRASASVYYSDIAGLIDPAPEVSNPTVQRTGTRDAEVVGGEITVERKLSSGLLGRLSYSYREATDSSTGRILTNAPRNALKAHFVVPIVKEKVFAGIETIYISDRLTLQGRNTRATWLINGTLFSRDLLPNLEVSASLYNLLDRRYYVPGGSELQQDQIEQDGRTFRVKVQYRF